MGRLAGLSSTEVIRKLRRAGFMFDRQAKGSHEIWLHPNSRRRVTVPRHAGALPEGTVRAIVSQSGLSVDAFLEL
jgi:predicted RNA binding protein YcfA (HicA-like mRNA interferase family)